MEFSLDFNYHTHTARCRHASGKDRDYIEKAIKAGIKELGFSDHAPMLFPSGDYYSGHRIFIEDTEDYVNSINLLKQEYEGRIKIHLGYEIEYYPELFDKTVAYLEQYGFEYLILGQHFTDNEYEKNSHYSGSPSDSTELFDKYINQALEGISTGRFLYIAHPDLFRYTGAQEIYIEKMTYFCTELKKLNCPLEFNLLGFGDKRHYPDKRFWNIVAQTGNNVVIGFDAHSPKTFHKKKLVNQTYDYLSKLGIKPLDRQELKL